MKLARIKKNWCDSKKEEQSIFAIIEDNGDKCVIAPVNCDLPIVPTQVIYANMLDIVGDTVTD